MINLENDKQETLMHHDGNSIISITRVYRILYDGGSHSFVTQTGHSLYGPDRVIMRKVKRTFIERIVRFFGGK